MGKCEKHDDQMTEWIMCLKAAKEVWDASFLKDDKYEMGVVPELILTLAKEIHYERKAMRGTVLHKEISPEYNIGDWGNQKAGLEYIRRQIWPKEDVENGDERRREPEQDSKGD
ncbi:hypothetical protein KAR91_62060 [Candidatus Pacearchaeota archaeon]|nr:hypothetical protein [Candidatus Pacearchaeota archaeon]